MAGATAPRIVTMSSVMHRAAPTDTRFASPDEINDAELGPTQLYGRSKLALILFIRFGLVKTIIGPCSDPILALSVHPGTVRFSSPASGRKGVKIAD